MSEVTIRKATQKDLPILLEFEQGIISFERPYDETLKEGKISYYDIQAMIESSNSEVIVAVVNKEVVGSAYVSVKEAKPYLKFKQFAYLGFMFVKPDHRGKGINKLIIEELKSWAKAQNIYEVRLDVYHDNESALKAYEKAGFQKLMINMRLGIQ